MNYLKSKLGIWGLIALVAVIFLSLFFIFKTGKYETYEVTRKNFEESISISGKIVPAQEVDLSFELAGKISNVYVKIGDKVTAGQIIASLEKSDIYNQINESTFTLESANAKLAELSNSNADENTKIDSLNNELLNILKKSYVTADDVIKNKVDIFFSEPNSRFPDFSKTLSNYFLRQEINTLRYEMQKVLTDWNTYNLQIGKNKITLSDVDYNISNLKKVEEILKKISSRVEDFNETDGVNRAQIDAYIANISNSRSTVSNLILEINKTYENLRSAESQIPVQLANVKNAEASLNTLKNKISKYDIAAPFDGVITANNIKVGQISKIGEIALTMIGDMNLEIETYIPEVLIFGVEQNDKAYVTLDAFGSDKIFEAYVGRIDPRETEKDGITTYRAFINFETIHEQVRPGMTAEIKVVKNKIDDVILIPSHLIQKESTISYVEIMEGKRKIKKEVQVGLFDGSGSVIVESGLKEKDLLVVPQK